MKEKIINLASDSLGGLSYKLLPYFIFQIALSALLVWLIAFIINKREKNAEIQVSVYKLMMISIVFCMLTFFAHYSLSLAIFWAIITGFLILKMSLENKNELYITIVAMALASGIGAGFVIPALVAFILIMLIIVLSSRTKKKS